jgi:hypothetical protein
MVDRLYKEKILNPDPPEKYNTKYLFITSCCATFQHNSPNHVLLIESNTMKYIAVFAIVLALAAPKFANAQADGAVGGSDDGSVNTNLVVYGEPIPPIEEVFTLSDAISRADELMGVEMIITGSIAGPCENDCWMVLSESGKSAKIVFFDRGVKLPTNVMGKEIEVFGNLEEEPQVMEKPSTSVSIRRGAAEPEKQYRIMARSIRLEK